MASVLVVLSSVPTSAAGQRALALAEALCRQGHALTLCCLQDAVILGSDRSPGGARAALQRMLDRGARCVVLGDDLALRGLQAGPGAATVDHPALVELLVAPHDRVIGAF